MAAVPDWQDRCAMRDGSRLQRQAGRGAPSCKREAAHCAPRSLAEGWRCPAGSARPGSCSARRGWRCLLTLSTWRPRRSGTPPTGPCATSAQPSAAPASLLPGGVVVLAWWPRFWDLVARSTSLIVSLGSLSTPCKSFWASPTAAWRPLLCWALRSSPWLAHCTWPTFCSLCSTTSAWSASAPTSSTLPSSCSTISASATSTRPGSAPWPKPRGGE